MGFTRFVACRPHLHLAVLATLPGEAGWPGANARVWMLERSIAVRPSAATPSSLVVSARTAIKRNLRTAHHNNQDTRRGDEGTR
jgi:hypothetical protein